MKLHNVILKPFNRMILKRSKYEELMEPLFATLMRLLKGQRINCVIDVGANKGQFALSLRKSGYRGRIISFEPIEECFNTLVEKGSDDLLWNAHRMALGTETGEIEINVGNTTEFSSILPASDYGEDQFGDDITPVRVEKVPIERLDVIWPKLWQTDEEPRLLLKMDTQGFDLHVFAGAEGILDRVWALQSELSVNELYEGMPDYMEALQVYRQSGFELVATNPIVSKDDMILIEFDCLMGRPT